LKVNVICVGLERAIVDGEQEKAKAKKKEKKASPSRRALANETATRPKTLGDAGGPSSSWALVLFATLILACAPTMPSGPLAAPPSLAGSFEAAPENPHPSERELKKPSGRAGENLGGPSGRSVFGRANRVYATKLTRNYINIRMRIIEFSLQTNVAVL
jgi:hypothetical protein